MKRLILLACLLATPVSAQQGPMSIEQRLGLQIANLSMANAELGLKIDQLQAEIVKLQAEIKQLKEKGDAK